MRLHDAAFLLTVAALITGLPSFADELQLLNFELEDQFNNVHRHDDVRGTIVLLIGSDGGGSQFNGAWGEAIDEALEDHPGYDQISHLAYADLRSVPFFLKGFIRSKFPKNPAQWALMDWKGVIAKTYAFTPKASNILVFARDGTLVYQASGTEPVDADLDGAVEALIGLLQEPSSAE